MTYERFMQCVTCRRILSAYNGCPFIKEKVKSIEVDMGILGCIKWRPMKDLIEHIDFLRGCNEI